jgi:DNA repair exonuclease SbcCD ATPase subunit
MSPFAQQSVRYSSWQERSAPLWLAAAFFAAALAPGAQARDLAGASRSGDTPLRFAQAQTTNPAELQPGPEQGQPKAEILARELAATRQDVISLQEKAETLAQELAMAHARIYAFEAQERQASDQAAEPKQTAEGGVADLRTSLQQERERASRLEQDLATARRDVEKQTALATKAGQEASQIKQAADSSVAELQKSLKQERERAVHLEQELAAARRDVEAQTAAGQMKQATDSPAELQKSLAQESAAGLEQDVAAARPAKARRQASRTKRTAESSAVWLKSNSIWNFIFVPPSR